MRVSKFIVFLVSMFFISLISNAAYSTKIQEYENVDLDVACETAKTAVGVIGWTIENIKNDGNDCYIEAKSPGGFRTKGESITIKLREISDGLIEINSLATNSKFIDFGRSEEMLSKFFKKFDENIISKKRGRN